MRLKNLVWEVILSIFDNLFYLVALVVPKSDRIWVFGAMFGEKYADNSKYFFEYVAQRQPDIQPVWISGNRQVVARLREQGREAHLFYAPRGIWRCMRAGVGCISHSVIRDIRPFVFTRRTLLVNLWHGIPLKRIAGDDDVSDIRNKGIFRFAGFCSKLLCPSFRRAYDLITACSDNDRRSFCSGFAVPPEKVVITGYPRNDALFSASPRLRNRKGQKVGIYMPTFRGQEGDDYDFFGQYGFDPLAMNAFLEQLNVHLYLKLHHFNMPKAEILAQIRSLSALSFYEEADVYADLSAMDFLVTDYSSIYFDYLLLNRPIIFAPFDLAGYRQGGRSFYYNYAEVTPGPKAGNWDEVCACIREAIEFPDHYSEARSRILQEFQSFRDGGSSERVYAEIRRLIDPTEQ